MRKLDPLLGVQSVLWLSLLWLLPVAGYAQDASFHHLAATPMLTNPALTGVMEGELRLTADYQERFTGLGKEESYNSVLAGAEWRGQVGRHNYYGLGLQLQHDRAGSSQYVRSQGLISVSYQQRLGDLGRARGSGQFLSAGVQAGFGQRGLDFNKMWFSEQYFVDAASRSAYVDRSLPSGEPMPVGTQRMYADVNAGILWFGSFGDRRGAYAGVAAYHLNTPDLSLLPGLTDPLDRRYVFYAGGELPLGPGYMSVLPRVRVMRQGPSTNAQVGGSFRYSEREWREIALRFGLFAQLANASLPGAPLNAATVAVGLEWEDLLLGLSYDLQSGPLAQPTNARGGYEISIIYTRAADYRGRVFCPRF